MNENEHREICVDHNFDNYIYRFIHCALCIKEMPNTLSPREWINVEVGIIKNGDIQVWCIRHEKNIAIFDMETSQIITDPDVRGADMEQVLDEECECCE